jgi:Cu/Ag efflux protein CusF
MIVQLPFEGEVMRDAGIRFGSIVKAAACIVAITVAALLPAPVAIAKDSATSKSDAAAAGGAGVYTRATVRSTFEEEGGKRLYIRLKLLPRGKLPFTTITFRVLDRALIAGLSEGASVGFVAERRGGENVLTSIREMPPCERFRPCE